MIIDAKMLKAYFKWLDGKLDEKASLYLGGGSAAILLDPGAESTKDVDAFLIEQTEPILKISRTAPETVAVDLNTRIQAFESYLPDDWPRHAIHSKKFSGKYLQVYAICPEDLVLMKTFRFGSKDIQDIKKMLLLRLFKPQKYKRRFLKMLPVVVGSKRVYAGSFVSIWRLIHPQTRLVADKILQNLGITE